MAYVLLNIELISVSNYLVVLISPRSPTLIEFCQPFHSRKIPFQSLELAIAGEFANYQEKFAFYDYALNFKQASEIRNYRHSGLASAAG